MKKSNKLLLGGFLALLFLISAIHITLFAKYKSGNYTIYRSADDLVPQSMIPFPNILFVQVQNVSDATIRFSNVAEAEKGDDEIRYTRKGDTLLISGNAVPGHEDFRHPVEFHVPYNATLSVVNSAVFFKDSRQSAVASPAIYLKKSNASFEGTDSTLRLAQLKVVATDSSAAFFRGDVQIDLLDLSLTRSTVKITGGTFGQLAILSDSLSTLSLPARHLQKANIKIVNPQ